MCAVHSIAKLIYIYIYVCISSKGASSYTNQQKFCYTNMFTVLADTFLLLLVVPPFLQVAGKQAAYHGLTEYYQSLVCKADKSVGEEIARLEVSNKLSGFHGQCCSSDCVLYFCTVQWLNVTVLVEGTASTCNMTELV